MQAVAISKRLLAGLALAGSLAAAVPHWAAAQAPPETCQALWRDLQAAAKARDLKVAQDANRKLQTGRGCNPLRLEAKAVMLDLHRQDDRRQEQAGTAPAERLAALKTALVRYGRKDDWEVRLTIADLTRQLADASGDRSAYADVSQAYYDVLLAAEDLPPSRPRPSQAERERIVMLAYQYQAMAPTLVKARGLYSRDVRKMFVARTPVPLQFVFAKDKLTELGQAEADRMAKVLKEENNPRIHLIGHTDPKGSDPYNDDLSQRRAAAIKRFLVGLGYPEDRITIEGRGKRDVEAFRRKIVDPDRYPEPDLHQILRRVEIVWNK
jgi:outer membrane protein OmpA-like peptidoglycan-associated protein